MNIAKTFKSERGATLKLNTGLTVSLPESLCHRRCLKLKPHHRIIFQEGEKKRGKERDYPLNHKTVTFRPPSFISGWIMPSTLVKSLASWHAVVLLSWPAAGFTHHEMEDRGVPSKLTSGGDKPIVLRSCSDAPSHEEVEVVMIEVMLLNPAPSSLLIANCRLEIICPGIEPELPGHLVSAHRKGGNDTSLGRSLGASIGFHPEASSLMLGLLSLHYW